MESCPLADAEASAARLRTGAHNQAERSEGWWARMESCPLADAEASAARLRTGAHNQAERSEGWWARMESNHRPPACEADALPLSHAPKSRSKRERCPKGSV